MRFPLDGAVSPGDDQPPSGCGEGVWSRDILLGVPGMVGKRGGWATPEAPSRPDAAPELRFSARVAQSVFSSVAGDTSWEVRRRCDFVCRGEVSWKDIGSGIWERKKNDTEYQKVNGRVTSCWNSAM